MTTENTKKKFIGFAFTLLESTMIEAALRAVAMVAPDDRFRPLIEQFSTANLKHVAELRNMR